LKKRVKDLAFALKIPKQNLLTLVECLDSNEKSFYRNWDEPKTDAHGNPRFENGKALTRPINAPIEYLKKIQSKILRNVLYKIELPEYYFGGLKNKDAVLNARHHQGNKYFFLTDMKDFYPSVHYSQVENALRKKGFYPDVARIITRICTKEGAIPQGCPSSSFLASLVVDNLASGLFTKCQESGLKVSLYVDEYHV